MYPWSEQSIGYCAKYGDSADTEEEMLGKICVFLDADIGNAMEFVRDEGDGQWDGWNETFQQKGAVNEY